MGSFLSRYRSDLIIEVTTGNNKGAGTDSNVQIILHDDKGEASDPIPLDNTGVNDFEKGHTDKFCIPACSDRKILRITKVEFWRDKSGLGDEWFVEKISVDNKLTNETYPFPVGRWIKAECHYIINCYDTSLPQVEEYQDRRTKELKDKRALYEYCQRFDNGPVQVKCLPPDEDFDCDYKWTVGPTPAQLKVKSKVLGANKNEWTKLDDIKGMFDGKVFKLPKCAAYWKDDKHFARSRLNGVCSTLIQLCLGIPGKLAVNHDMLEDLLEGSTLKHLIEKKKIFISDLEILEGMPCKEGLTMNAPIALFMVNKEDILVPLAIQLNQAPSEENPVFLPTDDPNLWLLAKMWYNNAEAAYHQNITHIGYTHFLMEGFSIATHRHMCVSHPIFKLLAPHFLYLLAINSKGLDKMICNEFDALQNLGQEGMHQLIAAGFERWNMQVEGNLLADFQRRGLDDEKVLPGFYYRDDALLLHEALKKYTTAYVDLYYDSDTTISNDTELQNWGQELNLKKDLNGVGIKGLPNDGVFKTKEDIVQVVHCIIFTCSVMHAASNFQQYEQYAFHPNYPSLMKGVPPKNKQDAVTEQDIIDAIGDKFVAFKGMVVYSGLSQKGTKSLGFFEIQYVYEPKAVELVNKLRLDLRDISLKIRERNKTREVPYEYLDPDYIPNAISI